MKKLFFCISLILLLAGCNTINTDTGWDTETQTNNNIDLSELEKHTVTRVIDGDTFVIDDNIKIRLIGVNTPESVAPESYLEKTGKQNTEEGKTASEFVKSLIENKDVYLEFDAGKEDQYGRILAYVWLEDGTMLQDILLREKYAELMTIPPNIKYSDHFLQIYRSTNPDR